MKFVLAETPRYWWPVTVRVPSREEAGKVAEQRFEMLFEPQAQEAALEAAEAIAGMPTLRERAAGEREHLHAICKGWRGVIDDTGGEVPFAADLLDQAAQQPWFRRGVLAAYRESLAGEEARLGN